MEVNVKNGDDYVWCQDMTQSGLPLNLKKIPSDDNLKKFLFESMMRVLHSMRDDFLGGDAEMKGLEKENGEGEGE